MLWDEAKPLGWCGWCGNACGIVDNQNNSIDNTYLVPDKTFVAVLISYVVISDSCSVAISKPK